MRHYISIIFILFTLVGFSQQLTWELSSDGVGVSNHQELECLDFTAGVGVTSFEFGSTGVSAKQWTTGALDLTDYFQVGFRSSALDTFEFNTIFNQNQ